MLDTSIVLPFATPNFSLLSLVGEKLESNAQIREREWLKQRLGKFTASQAYRLLTYPNKPELPAGAITYIMEKVCEIATEYEESQGFTNAAIQWGKDHELEAIEWFADKMNYTVDATGENQQFVELTELNAGATPDGLIDDDILIEVKCPNSITHLSYLHIKSESDLKEVEPKYYWQMMFQFLVTGRTKGYFISYDPRFKKDDLKLHIAIINPYADDITFLTSRLKLAHDYFNAVIKHRDLI
jgi:hypothetical protein